MSEKNMKTNAKDADGSFMRYLSVLFDRSAYKNTVFLLLMSIMGFVYFLYFALGLSVGFSSMSLLVGIPLLMLFMLGFVLVARFQNFLAKEFLNLKGPKLRTVKKKGFLNYLKRTFTNIRLYSTALYAFLTIPMGQAYVIAASILFGIAVALIVIPTMGLLGSVLSFQPDALGLLIVQPFTTAAGVIVFATALHLGNLFADLHKKMSKHMLIRGSA